MITTREIVTSLFGAWRLAQFQADGLRYLDGSREGARRSFWAAVIALPAAIPLTLIRLSMFPPRDDDLRVVLIETVAYVIGWAAFPVVAQIAARIAEREQHFARVVCAYNWTSLLQVGVLLLCAPISAAGILPSSLEMLFELAVRAALIAYLAFTIRVALDVPWPAAIGLALVEFFLGISVFRTVLTLEDAWPLALGAV
jgi:hypothetical protein